MTTWPSGLPFLRVGLEDQASDNVLRTDMDAGPAKLRRRWSVDRRFVTGTQYYTGSQRATLETFYGNNDVLEWDHEDPSSGSTSSYRFAGRPSFRLVAGNDTSTSRLWEASVPLEIMP